MPAIARTFLRHAALALFLAAASSAASASPASNSSSASAAGASARPAVPHAVRGPRAAVALEHWVKTRARPTLRDRLVSATLGELGVPYTWGGDKPDDGFDCSGLVLFVFRKVAGLELPHRARLQRRLGKPVASAQLQPGDLVFFNTLGNPASHVGIYIGEQRFVHAPSRGAKVRVDRLDNRYWARRYTGARRYVPPSQGTEEGTRLAEQAA